jgi:hypothetical protein
MAMTFTGDWKKVEAIIGNRNIAERTIKQAKTVAMKRTLAYFQAQIRLNMKSSGQLAGAPFKPLSPVTIKLREERSGKSGGEKPLLDTGDMWKNIIPVFVDEDEGFVGLKRGETHKRGGSLVDIGEVHEFGAILESGVEVPMRPFIGPVLDKFKDEAMEKYLEGIKSEIK